MIHGTSLQFSNEKPQLRSERDRTKELQDANELEMLKKAFLEVVTLNESLEAQVEDLTGKLKEKDEVIEV